MNSPSILNDDLIVLNDDLDKIDGMISQQREVVELTRENSDLASLRADINREKEFLSARFSGEKTTDAISKSKSLINNENLLIDEIRAKSRYRKEQIKLDNLLDKRDSLKEKSYNIRATVKVFGG